MSEQENAPPPPPGSDGVYEPFPSFAQWSQASADVSGFDAYVRLLDEARSTATPESLAAALTTANRYAAVDTNAIEGIYPTDRGFTRTVATQAASWEAEMESRGGHARLAFEDAMNGYEYVLDAATTRAEVSEVWIRQLHEILCASQETYTVHTDQGAVERPLAKGRYKSSANSPTLLDGRIHAYASVLDTPPEMERLIQELRSDAFVAAHPIVQASYAHYAYVCVHPFADGNGRVARALASVYLYRSPGIPLIVFADQRNEYYDTLEAADAGNYEQFIAFIGVRIVDAIGIVRAMVSRTGPPLSASLKSLGAIFDVGAETEELRAASVRLRGVLVDEMNRQINALPLPSQLRKNANVGRVGSVAAPSGYRDIGDEGYAYLLIEGTWPVRVRSVLPVAVFALEHQAISDLLVASRSDDGMEVWIREVVPVVTEALKLKVAGWVESKLAEMVADLDQQATSST